MNKESFDKLPETLASLISELKFAAAPDEPVPAGEFLTLDGRDADNSRWLTVIEPYLERAQTFEIHCWHGEEAILALALPYGIEQSTDWKYGRIVKGTVTPEFAQMLKTLPKPTDTELYNKMTPFFNVFLDDFQSCHYGTELYLPTAPTQPCRGTTP